MEHPMARLVKLVSAKSGATPTNRRVLNATTTTSAPTLSTEGVLLEGPRYAWLTFKIAGTAPGSVVIDLYAYDPVSQEWAKLMPNSEYQFSTSVAGTVRYKILVEGGPIRLQPVVSTLTLTGSPSVQVWIASSIEEP
jgi:hypothetical protein